MTRLATQSLTRLQNPYYHDRLIPQTILWAFQWLKKHNISFLPECSQTNRQNPFQFKKSQASYQQTLTQMMNENAIDLNQISHIESLDTQTIKQHIDAKNHQLLKLLSRKQKQNIKIKKKKLSLSTKNSNLIQTKLTWKTNVSTSKTLDSRPRIRYEKNSDTSKWDKFLNASQLREKYHLYNRNIKQISSNKTQRGTDLQHFLIPSKRKLEVQTDTTKQIRKTSRYFNSRDCKTKKSYVLD